MIDNNSTISMENTCFCPGKIITGKTRNWYLPLNNDTVVEKKHSIKIYCEHCLNEYGYGIPEVQFKLIKSKEYSCSSDRDFNDSSISINGVRVSIVNPNNFYRYKKLRSTNATATIGIPNNEPFMIVVENCDKNTTSITVDDIVHDNVENTYYINKETFHIIDTMSHNEQLIFNEQNRNIISLKVIKWKKNTENGSSYLVMNGDPINFSIKLTKNDNNLKEIKESLEYYQSLKDQCKKIIIIDDFV